MKEDKKLVFIYGPFDYQKMVLIKTIMEREGIAYFIKNEFGALTPTGSREMELYVPEDKAEFCIDLLKDELE